MFDPPIGEGDEAVRLFIRDQEVTNIYQKYSIQVSVFEQPAAFTLSLGDGSTVKELREKFKKGDEFRLQIGDRQVVRGIIDGRGVSGIPSVMNFRGRDATAVLMESYVTADVTFQNETYFDLTSKVLDICGLGDRLLFTDNDRARASFSGIQSRSVVKANLFDQAYGTSENTAAFRAREAGLTSTLVASNLFGGPNQANLDGQSPLFQAAYLTTTAALPDGLVVQKKTTHKKVTAKVGKTWWEFLQEQYKKAALFLWATPEGDFVLGEPHSRQAPSYALYRKRGQTRTEGNILEASLNEGSGGNHIECFAYGRAGTGKNSRLQCRGFYRDISKFAESMRYPVAFVDKDIKSNEEAEYAARRRIAEERRRSRTLSYVVSGHRVLTPNGFTRAIWTPDTTVDVQDQEIGIEEPLYLHSVTFQRTPETSTILDLAWPEDLVFAAPEKAA